MEKFHIVAETGLAALLFASSFLFGRRFHPLRPLIRDDRVGLSFGAGMSVAYIFIHVMPELHAVRASFAEGMNVPLPLKGMVVYYLALVGFLLFYFMDQLRERMARSDGETGEVHAFRLDIGGFAAYACLMGYLLVRNLGESHVSTAFFGVTIAVHFLALTHSLEAEHGVAYRRIGRFVLAGMSLLGWGLGLAFPLPQHVLALLVAFISGAVVMNATIMEIHSQKEGHLLPFAAGGLIYGLILLPLG
ncbi:MAG TPA: hypothetical protein VFS09_10990 [Candidatus Eisenbacteria bacterium]|nr:hypothetical protein [Candidatus Eisenbacteria bacterium]